MTVGRPWCSPLSPLGGTRTEKKALNVERHELRQRIFDDSAYNPRFLRSWMNKIIDQRAYRIMGIRLGASARFKSDALRQFTIFNHYTA